LNQKKRPLPWFFAKTRVSVPPLAAAAHGQCRTFGMLRIDHS
jgi:hypothetical protein